MMVGSTSYVQYGKTSEPKLSASSPQETKEKSEQWEILTRGEGKECRRWKRD